MKLTDLILLGFSNLWQTKLRSFLTILGVVIGIGALSSMVSFGTGMQKNITDAFKNNDLFTSMNITPAKIDINDLSAPDPSKIKRSLEKENIPLNDSILDLIKKIDGVEIAHPEIIIPCKLGFKEKNTSTRVQALPAEIGKYKPYTELVAGSFFSSDSSFEIVLSYNTLKSLGIILQENGKKLSLSSKDSAESRVIASPDTLIGKRVYLIAAKIDIGSAVKNPFAFLGGTGKEIFTEDTTEFIISGILKKSGPFISDNMKGGAVIPSKTAQLVPTLDFYNIWDILSDKKDENQYSSIYVRVGKVTDLDLVRRKIENMGLNVFTLSDQLQDIKKGFLVMDSILGAIGIVALLIAALGIINTMVMSILERTREIGIMKAIGGSDREIKTIFFVEAGAIGLIGSVFGLILGWLFTKVANIVINTYVIPENDLNIDLFYFPIWLILGAMGFSILISLAAGLYPASRAARIDPVKALRHD